MKNKWKIILSGILAVFIIGFMAFEALKGMEADVLKVQTGSAATTFKEEGIVTAAFKQNVFALFPGEITEVLVEEGQEVKAGDPLLTVNTREIDYQLQQLGAQLKGVKGEQSGTFQKPHESQVISQRLLVEQAERDLSVSQINLERFTKLYEAGAVSIKDFEDATYLAENAKNNLTLQQQALQLLEESSSGTAQFYAGRIEALQAQIGYLEYQKSRSQVSAGIGGVVGNIPVKKDDFVNAGTLLLNVFQPGNYELEVYILTSGVASIHEGMEVDLILETKDEDQVFKGVVKNIAPSAVSKTSALGLEEQRVKVTITWEDAGDMAVFPGYRLDAEFTTDKRDNVLVVPKTALFPYDSGDALWLVKGGKAAIQPVKTGFETKRDVVITEGINAGDIVILDPQLEGLKAGKKIIASGK